jgi:hypothetical protein
VLLAALPGFVVLFLQDRPETYSRHWSAPLLPVIWLAAAVGLARVQGRLRRPASLGARASSTPSFAGCKGVFDAQLRWVQGWGRFLPFTGVALLLAGTGIAYALDSYFPGGRQFDADHYYMTELEDDIRRALDQVPPGASFVGTRRVVPHLAARRDLYQFPFSYYESPLRPDGQRQEYYILDLTDSPTRRAVEPAESDSVLEKEPRYHISRYGRSVLLLSKTRPEPSVARGETFGGLTRLVGLDWLAASSALAPGATRVEAEPRPSPAVAPGTRASEGKSIGLRLYWEAIPRSPSDATRVLRLTGPGRAVVSEVVGQPVSEYLPLRDWERGQVIAEELWLAADASRGPGTYRVVVGWRGRDGRPLAVDGSGMAELELARFEWR